MDTQAQLSKEHKIYTKYFQSEDHLTQHCNGMFSKLPPDELLKNTAENLANKRDFPQMEFSAELNILYFARMFYSEGKGDRC